VARRPEGGVVRADVRPRAMKTLTAAGIDNNR
jgi:hypothetical protein